MLYSSIAAQVIQGKSEYRFHHYGTADGLKSEYSAGVLQDSLGFVWIQHFGGLSRFDGYNFKIYKHEPDDSLTSALNIIFGFANFPGHNNVWVTQYQPNVILSKYEWELDGFIQYRIEIPDAMRAGVRRFLKDGNIIWIATTHRGLYSYDLQTKKIARHINGDSTQSSYANQNSILNFLNTRDSLVVTTREGIWCFDKVTKIFSRPQCNAKDSALLYHREIFGLSPSKKSPGCYWVNVKGGTFVKVGADLSVIQTFYHGDIFFSQGLSVDKDDVFWFGTQGQGLYRLDPHDNSIVNIRHNPDDPYSPRSNYINDVLVDRDQNIWITSDKGVDVLRKSDMQFHNYNFTEGVGANTIIEANATEHLVMVSGGNLLMAPVSNTNYNKLEFQKLSSFNVRAFRFWRGKKYFWIREPQGVKGYPLSISGIPNSGPVKFLPYDAKDPNKLINFSAPAPLWEDPSENLWIGSNADGLIWVSATIPYGTPGSVVTFKHDDKDTTTIGGNLINSMLPEGDNSFWLISSTGVDLITVTDVSKPDIRVEHVFNDREIPFVIFKASSKDIYLGTANGLYSITRNDHAFNVNPLWKEGSVRAIQEDENGRLWLYSDGPVLYDPIEKIAIKFNSFDGIDHANGYFANMMLYTKAGIAFVFDQSGFSAFIPSTFNIDRKNVYPVLTKLLINNNAVGGTRLKGDKDFTSSVDITVLTELIIDYRHNNFSISFSAMEMTAPEKNRYRYKLEEYNDDWIETDFRNRSATYTNLNAGNYTFRLKASNHHGIWSDYEKTLLVRILPPPWKTWWAYSLYAITFVSLLLYWRNYESKRIKLKHRAEQLTELDHLKSQFFANISHEFRTPITLILSPLKDMINGTFKGDQKPVLAVMMRNGQRLLRLINQLLDLSKIESGKMELHLSRIELVQLLRDISASYESLAARKKIKYFFYPEMHELNIAVDIDKIEKVIHNLLANAFKFTKEGDEIIVNLKADAKHAVIIVKDSGIGIPSDQLDKVFDRFYQVDNSQTREYEGSGLGMALAKELIELHKGSIIVESQEGKGTSFSVRLPLKLAGVHNIINIRSVETNGSVEFVNEEEQVQGHESEIILSDQVPVLLIVEDNMDMRHYIRKTLSDQYQIIEAENGKEGIEKTEEIIPDLIISDIMMPVVDGYQLCKHIKTTELTSHIPIILLTAKADRESKLSGLEIGADDYLSKPFDADELKLIVRNRIEERRKMRERFSKEITLEPKHIAVTSLDEKFLAKVMIIIEAHMDDETFSIDDFSREANYSNIHFYRKIKALTGQTPSMFLRTIRLKRAAELLASKSDNVTQIAYSVGFGSLSYFNKCFKEQFGVTPGQFANNAK